MVVEPLKITQGLTELTGHLVQDTHYIAVVLTDAQGKEVCTCSISLDTDRRLRLRAWLPENDHPTDENADLCMIVRHVCDSDPGG